MLREQFKDRVRYHSFFWPALLVLLSACAQTDNKLNLETFSFPQEKKTKTTIGSAKKTVNETLKSEKDVGQVLKDFGGVGSNLKKKIENLQQANGNMTSGLGGLYGHIFLENAKKHLTTQGNWKSDASVTQEIFGQITDYYRDENTGEGLFHVTTVVVSTLTNPGNVTKTNAEAYHWQVEVDPGGFSVHKNCHKFATVNCDPGKPEQPFPGTMDFDDEMLQTVITRDFHYKLWAKGTAIKVKNVYKYKKKLSGGTIPDGPSVDPNNWKRLNENKYQGLYTSSATSCIDMMTEDVPPTNLASLPPVPFYCLGRCDHPLIINSR